MTKDMVRRESGLIVPRSSVADEREQKRWTWETWKHVKRVIRIFASEDVQIVLKCSKCNKVLSLDRLAKGFSLSCDCRVRKVQ